MKQSKAKRGPRRLLRRSCYVHNIWTQIRSALHGKTIKLGRILITAPADTLRVTGCPADNNQMRFGDGQLFVNGEPAGRVSDIVLTIGAGGEDAKAD